MAIFHLSVRVIQRSRGRSATGAAAYRAAVKIHDHRTGETHDYRARSGVAASEILLPQGAPRWMEDRSVLWNLVERTERRWDARVAREMDVALPVELPRPLMLAAARQFVRDEVAAAGMVADVAWHDLDSGNPHFHVLMTTRELVPDGFGKKVREWDGWGDPKVVARWREAWARVANQALAQTGAGVRVDHRSLVDQGTERLPTIHLGRWASINENPRLPAPSPVHPPRSVPWNETPLGKRDARTQALAAIRASNTGLEAMVSPAKLARVARASLDRKITRWHERNDEVRLRAWAQSPPLAAGDTLSLAKRLRRTRRLEADLAAAQAAEREAERRFEAERLFLAEGRRRGLEEQRRQVESARSLAREAARALQAWLERVMARLGRWIERAARRRQEASARLRELEGWQLERSRYDGLVVDVFAPYKDRRGARGPGLDSGAGA